MDFSMVEIVEVTPLLHFYLLPKMMLLCRYKKPDTSILKVITIKKAVVIETYTAQNRY